MCEKIIEKQQKKKEILQARAKILAREPDTTNQLESYIDVIEFYLAYEKYGIESIYVREVCPLRELTPLPCTPPFVLGIVNMRGEIISVIDLKKFFGLSETAITDMNKIIIVYSAEMSFGILADNVLGVYSISQNELQPSLATLTGIRADYLKGVTSERLIVLDIARLLSDKKIIVHEEVEA
jgi:purine-binding chemotaxis protein CheW